MELCISKEIVYLHWNIVCYISIQICYFELDIILEFKYYISFGRMCLTVYPTIYLPKWNFEYSYPLIDSCIYVL